jgi:Tfp pilus assembly protein PilO
MSEGRMAARGRFDLRQDFWRVVAVLLVLVLLNIGFYLFLNLPRLRALADLSSGRDEVRRALLETNRSTQTMQDLIARYDQENTRLDQFYAERIGTQMEHMTRIQQGVRAVATEFRIDPESIDYNSSEIENSDLTRFQITIPLVGGYPNLRHFINRIETAPFLATIDSIELAGSRDGGAMLSLTIRISTYFLSPPMAPDEAGAALPAAEDRPAAAPKRPRR